MGSLRIHKLLQRPRRQMVDLLAKFLQLLGPFGILAKLQILIQRVPFMNQCLLELGEVLRGALDAVRLMILRAADRAHDRILYQINRRLLNLFQIIRLVLVHHSYIGGMSIRYLHLLMLYRDFGSMTIVHCGRNSLDIVGGQLRPGKIHLVLL